MNKRLAVTAVCGGTFDPITNGHRDVIERASHLFNRVIVAIAEVSKQGQFFPAEERENLVKGALTDLQERVEVLRFQGLLVDFVKKVGGQVIVRGLRATSDYEYEAQMALMNKRLADNIETVFLMTSEHCSCISSSIVKEVARHGGDVSSLVPANVAERLKKFYSQQQ